MLILRKALQTIKADTSIRHIGSFSAAMAEALAKHEAEQKAFQAKKQPYKPRYNGRVKKRQWEQSSETEEGASKRPANFDPADRVKRRKYAMLLGYSGANYFGMQRNPGMKTIEEDVFKAMFENKLVTEEMFNQAQLIQFQRAARTDKGVSAARQVCSLKFPDEFDLKALNASLPDEIRIFSIVRVTKGFNSKDQCNSRTYTYTLPTISFAEHQEKEVQMESYRAPKERIDRLNEILKQFEGTKNFHNFTSRKDFIDPSSKRYIMSFTCGEPFLSPDNIEFATITIQGQSFMLHQIRKMVGLSLAVLRGHTTEETIKRSFTEERLDIPMAPGLGLVLDRIHYDRYNERYGQDGVHAPLTWEKEEPEIQEFINKYIFPTIYNIEMKEKPMVAWLETLGFHSYDVRTDQQVDEAEETREIKASECSTETAEVQNDTETSNLQTV